VRALALALVLALAACGGAGAGGQSRGQARGAALGRVEISPTEAGPQGRVPQFVVQCRFSHIGAADPIVHPGMVHHGHLHIFFGNTGTDADSTAASLGRARTTCDQKLDRAAYWAPALLDHGTPVTPTKAVAYYRPGVGIDPAAVHPYPFGLKMLGGDQTATSPQPLDVVAWSCGTGSTRTATPATCPPGRPLRLAVAFPDCWDGDHLDSPDHTDHVARSRDGACPTSHPVPIPQLLLTITWPVTGPGHALGLASGSVLTGHADFINAWDEAKLRTEVTNCLQRGITCGVASTRS
jgi:Domain of unknown function (DUF1996)